MRLFVAIVLACPACFAKPLPPGTCASWSAWSAPSAFDGIDTLDSETGPWLSPDRRELVFSRAQKAWIATRTDPDGAFETPTEIVLDPPVAADSGSFISDDDQSLYYTATPMVDHDLYVATRTGRGQPFGNATKIDELSSRRNDMDPDLDRDQLAMVLARNIDPMGQELHLATRDDLQHPWSVVPLSDLNTAFDEVQPTLSGDGLEIVFATDRDGSTRKLYEAHRTDLVSTRFSDVRPFEGTAGLAGQLADPQLSRDGTTLVFARDVGSSNYDLFSIERTCGDR